MVFVGEGGVVILAENGLVNVGGLDVFLELSLIHISEPTRH